MEYILPIGLVLLAVVGLAVRLILKPEDKRRGPVVHIGDSKAMRDRGIHCATSQHFEARKTNKNKIDMKNLKTILLIPAAVLALTACNKQADAEVAPEEEQAPAAVETKANKLPIAVVNTDSVVAKYQFAIDANDRLQNKQEKARADMNSRAKSLQNDMADFQNKYENNAFLSRERAEAAQQSIVKKNNALEQLNDKYTQELLQEQEDLTLQLRDSLQNYLKVINKDGKYEMILQNSAANETVLFSKPVYDITKEVIKGLNARYKK